MFSLVSAAETTTTDTTTTDCNLWCKIVNFFSGGSQENLAGEAASADVTLYKVAVEELKNARTEAINSAEKANDALIKTINLAENPSASKEDIKLAANEAVKAYEDAKIAQVYAKESLDKVSSLEVNPQTISYYNQVNSDYEEILGVVGNAAKYQSAAITIADSDNPSEAAKVLSSQTNPSAQDQKTSTQGAAPQSPSSTSTEIEAAQTKIDNALANYNKIRSDTASTPAQVEEALKNYNTALDEYDQILAKAAGQEQTVPANTAPASTSSATATANTEKKLAEAKKADLEEMRLTIQALEQSVNLDPQIEQSQQRITETRSIIEDCQSDAACRGSDALQIHQIRLANLEDSQRQLVSLKSDSEINSQELAKINSIIKKDGSLSDDDVTALLQALGKTADEIKTEQGLNDEQLKKYVTEIKDALKQNQAPSTISPSVKPQQDSFISDIEHKAELGQGNKDDQGNEGLSYFQAADAIDAEADRIEERLTSLEGLASSYNQVKGNLPQVSFASGVPEAVSGSQLNGIGDYLGVSRNPGESDSAYRARINTPGNKAILSQLDSYAKDKSRLDQLREKEDQLRYQHSFLEGSTVGSVLKGEWTGDFGKYGSLTRNIIDSRNYQPLSSLLIGEDNYQKWRSNADADWLNQIDLSWHVSNLLCEADDYKKAEQPGKNSRFVMTPSGSYQFVGSIQAEISSKTSAILCERSAEQNFICKGGLTCKDEQFCYKSEDDPEPAQGYFYKISWGVSAPQDEAHTVNIDEDGKTIKFNLYLDQDNTENGNEKYIFSRGALSGKSVIALAHGEVDGGTITSYLPDKYNRVCIVFDADYHPRDKNGGDVNRLCASFIPLDKGVVEYDNSDHSGSSGSTKTTSGEVQQLI